LPKKAGSCSALVDEGASDLEPVEVFGQSPVAHLDEAELELHQGEEVLDARPGFAFDPVLFAAFGIDFEDAFQVYPAESAYGAIQVKSKLTKGELRSAFENISSYKKLQKAGTRQTRHGRGFGIIFAYDTESTWARLTAHIQELASQYPRAELPNAIVVLNKGYFLFGDETSARIKNAEFQQIQELRVFGHPDRQGDCLYSAYVILMLLRDGEAPAVPIHAHDIHRVPRSNPSANS
jgi:hypothetical protein